jgi:DNA-binding NtrC family response regulator
MLISAMLIWAIGKGALRIMQTAGGFQPQPSLGLKPPAPGVLGHNPVEGDAPPLQIVGLSASWRKLLAQADMVAPHVQVAAIEGEPGSGKQTLARYLFNRSSLSGSTFHRRDARDDLLTPPGQGLLLGVLKAMQDRPPSRAVILASSQTPLRQMASQGLMLPDLAFRLSAVRFTIPPLRLRREDIAPLAQSLLDRICHRYQQRPVILGPGSLARLLQHAWPGNVRELASVLETALLEAVNGVIRPEDLNLPSALEASAPVAPPLIHPENLSLDVVIRQHVEYVLEINRGNKLRTARQLCISRSTLYRILGNEAVITH